MRIVNGQPYPDVGDIPYWDGREWVYGPPPRIPGPRGKGGGCGARGPAGPPGPTGPELGGSVEGNSGDLVGTPNGIASVIRNGPGAYTVTLIDPAPLDTTLALVTTKTLVYSSGTAVQTNTTTILVATWDEVGQQVDADFYIEIDSTT